MPRNPRYSPDTFGTGFSGSRRGGTGRKRRKPPFGWGGPLNMREYNDFR